MRRGIIGLAVSGVLALSASAVRAQGADGGRFSPNVFNPTLTVFGNATLRVDDRPVPSDGGDRIDDTFNLRETEVDLRAAVDPFADGVLILTAESEVPGEFEVGVEEGYVTLKAFPWLVTMPLGLRAKVGRFRMAFGQMNVLHTHDLPQTTRPLAAQSFLGGEGLLGQGLSVSGTGAPFSGDVAISGVVEAVTGGHLEAGLGGDTREGFLGRSQLFYQVTDTHAVMVGTSAYAGSARRTATVEGAPGLGGVDFLYKWKPHIGGEWRSFILGAEYMQAVRSDAPDGQAYFVFAQHQGSRSLYYGVRWDWLRPVDDEAPEIVRQLTPYASYYFSEFLRLRASWERTFEHADTAWLELTFVFGSHPPEPYWVNR